MSDRSTTVHHRTLIALQRVFLFVTVAAVTTLPISLAYAQEVPLGGGIVAMSASSVDGVSFLPSPLASAAVFRNAQYGSGGVALRNRATGSFSVSGVLTPVQEAFLYWAVITTGTPTAANQKVTIARQFPSPLASATVTGTPIGSGPQPCWAGDTITVFRASVPVSLANGDGLYKITLMSGASGSTDGHDPWISPLVLPLMEGASLVMVGTGTGNVAVYDSGLAGVTFHGNPGITYTLTLPVSATGALTLLDNIGADGQIGTSRLGGAGYGDEKTTINGKVLAGKGSPANDSDWNGGTGSPLPQLWDDKGHDITAATPSGTTKLTIKINNSGESTYDCLTPVANIVEVH